MKVTIKSYTIIYRLNHKHGFSSTIKVEALNVDQAMQKAKEDIAKCYGSEMAQKFEFKPEPTMCGAVIRTYNV